MTGSPQLTYPVITLIAGIGIPIMAAMNAHLGARLGNPAAASVVLFLVGLIAALLTLGFTDMPSRATVLAAPRLYFLGGLLMAFYVLSITWIAPRFGVGNAIFFVLLGQLISASIIDHFGLFGATAVPIEGRRIIGLVFMAIGVFLARRMG